MSAGKGRLVQCVSCLYGLGNCVVFSRPRSPSRRTWGPPARPPPCSASGRVTAQCRALVAPLLSRIPRRPERRGSPLGLPAERRGLGAGSRNRSSPRSGGCKSRVEAWAELLSPEPLRSTSSSLRGGTEGGDITCPSLGGAAQSGRPQEAKREMVTTWHKADAC